MIVDIKYMIKIDNTHFSFHVEIRFFFDPSHFGSSTINFSIFFSFYG